MVAITGLVVGMLGLAHTGMAQAADELGDTVAAVVTGSTRTPEPPPLMGDPVTRRGSFEDVGIAGVFTAQGPTDRVSACAVVIDVGEIEFETTETLLEGSGTIDDASFGASTAGVCSVTGTITNGEFDRIGTLARAELDISYTVTTVGESHTGNCHALVEVTATPLPNDLEEAVVVGAVECDNITDEV